MLETVYFMPDFALFQEMAGGNASPFSLFMNGFTAALLLLAAAIWFYLFLRFGLRLSKNWKPNDTTFLDCRKWRAGAVCSIIVLALVFGFPLLPAGTVSVFAGSFVQFAGMTLFEFFFILLLIKYRFRTRGLKLSPLILPALSALVLPLTGSVNAPLALRCLSLTFFALCLLFFFLSLKHKRSMKSFFLGGLIYLAFALPGVSFFRPAVLLAYLFLEYGFFSDAGSFSVLVQKTLASGSGPGRKSVVPQTSGLVAEMAAVAMKQSRSGKQGEDAEKTEKIEEIEEISSDDEGAVNIKTAKTEQGEDLAPFIPKEFLAILNKESVDELKLGDHIKQEMTIFFSDIRQFTDLSEKLTPEESFAFINSYLSRIVPEITKNGGFVDKYIGDAILALFPQADGADMAVRTAISIQERIMEYNVHRASCGYRPLSMGIGLHTGLLMVGVVGVKDRMQNTVISDAVNLASRLESITKVFGVSLAISEETFKKLSNPGSYKYRFIGKVRVKGKSAPVSIFEIFDGINPAMQERKIKANMFFEQGMFHYYQKNYSEAMMNFRKVREVLPDDGASAFYMDNCLSKIKSL